MPGPQSQPPIAIPVLFPPLGSQVKSARAKEPQTSASANSPAADQFAHSQEAYLQMDTAAMLQHIESLVREHVGTAAEAQVATTELSVKTVHAQDAADRMRGGLSSSPTATFAATERTSKHESKAVALPLPRNVHRDGGAAKVASVQPSVVGVSKEGPVVLDNGDGVSVQQNEHKDIPVRSEDQAVAGGSGESSDVIMNDVTPASDSTLVAPAITSHDRQDAQNTVDAPNLTEASNGVTTEDVEMLPVQPLKENARAPVPDETLPEDTSEEDEPLSVVLKAKRADAIKPMIRINLMRHRPASNLLSDTTLSSTPLRIRIPSFRKSSPARVAISPFPSEPTSPVESSSPPSPNLPTSTAETSLDSELSDLTPIEDSTDEGESEIEEPESADDVEEERPKVSLLLDIAHGY